MLGEQDGAAGARGEVAGRDQLDREREGRAGLPLDHTAALMN